MGIVSLKISASSFRQIVMLFMMCRYLLVAVVVSHPPIGLLFSEKFICYIHTDIHKFIHTYINSFVTYIHT